MKKERLLPPSAAILFLCAAFFFGCAESSDAKTNSDDDLDLEQESLEAEETPLCPAEIAARPFTINKEEVFYIGPYLMFTDETSTTIMWETETECGSKVEYGKTADKLDLLAEDAEPKTMHEIRATGLTADTRYYYKVSSCDKSSPVYEFYTAPHKGAPIKFVAISDTQSHPEVSSLLFEAMAAKQPYLTIHAGDEVGSGGWGPGWKTEFYDPLRPIGHSVPLFVAIGNHEGNSPFFYKYASYPPSLPDDPESESFYSFTYGNVFFVMIDTNKAWFDIVIDPENPHETPISKWLKGAIESPEAKAATWRIAVGHQNAFSESWSPGDCGYDGNVTVREWLWPMLAANKFHAYLSGHTHDYERGMKDGVAHMILGGGGGTLDEYCKEWPETKVNRYVHHFLYFEAGCDKLTMSAFELGKYDEPFDTFTLQADKWGEIVSENTKPLQ